MYMLEETQRDDYPDYVLDEMLMLQGMRRGWSESAKVDASVTLVGVDWMHLPRGTG